LEQPGADAWIRQIASLDPAAVELYFGDQEYTWADLTSFAEALGQALAAAGTPPGAPVAWIARNHPSLVAGALGLLFGGYCISPINPHVPPAKLAEDVRAFNMAAVVAAPEDWTPDLIAAAREIGAAGFVLRLGSGDPVSAVEDLSRVGPGPFRVMTPGTVIERISSGTTGEPKRFPVTAENFVRGLALAGSTEPGAKIEVSLKRSPAIVSNTFAHSAGLWEIMTAFFHGRPIALHERFTVEGWHESVRRFRPKAASLLPAMVTMVLEADLPREDLSSIVVIRSSSAPLPPETQQAFDEKYGIPVLGDYSASEFMGGISIWSLADYRRYGASKRGSVGRLKPDVEGKVTDPETGEELAAGEVGVLNLRTPRHGPDWIKTTDLAALDADGFLFLKGRADEAINRGGFKILPEQVADVIRLHEGVREVAVLGVKDPRLGEAPMAVIEPYPDRAVPSADELAAFVRDHLPPYYVPVAFEVVREMPRTNSLKISRPALRDSLKDKYQF